MGGKRCLKSERSSEEAQAVYREKTGALLSLGSGEEKLWHIIDICECGLAFRYLGQLEDPKRFSELVLLSKDASFCLEKVPSR